MRKINKAKYEEFHDGEKEFCRESGPLVTKKIDTPSAIAKAIVMSLATVATMAAVIMTPVFKFTPKVVDVEANTAIIQTIIENIPENSELIHTLVTEANFFGARRRLNRELKILFDKHGIEIPYNQIVAHQNNK